MAEAPLITPETVPVPIISRLVRLRFRVKPFSMTRLRIMTVPLIMTVMGAGGITIRESTPRGVPIMQPRQSHFRAFQSTCFHTKGRCSMLAEISQIKIRAVASTGGRKKVKATTRVREKPKPLIPRRIPPKITASPMKTYKNGVSESMLITTECEICSYLSQTVFFVYKYY